MGILFRVVVAFDALVIVVVDDDGGGGCNICIRV
jgi:hypothetical protein